MWWEMRVTPHFTARFTLRVTSPPGDLAEGHFGIGLACTRRTLALASAG